jgi:hypothetical protein
MNLEAVLKDLKPIMDQVRRIPAHAGQHDVQREIQPLDIMHPLSRQIQLTATQYDYLGVVRIRR